MLVRSESAFVRGAVIAACLVAPLALAGCGGDAPGAQGRRGAGPGSAVPIRTTTTRSITVQRQVELAGNLLSPDQAKVSSEVAGVVRQVLIEIGSEVRVGQPLVRLEPRELDLALARAESSLRQTYAQLGMHQAVNGDAVPPPDEEVASVKTALANRDDARANYQRAQQLSGRGLLSPVDLQTAETRMKVAEASYQSAFDTVRSLKAALQDRQAAYQLAQKKLNDAVVKAPIAGAVVERLVQTGEYIGERTPVATIAQMNPLKLRTGVQERYAGLIRAGQPVEFRVESFGDVLFHGKVAYVSPTVDQTMRSFTVEALVDNADKRLKPGFFAKGVIQTTLDQNVIAVSDAAVSTLAGVSSVYIVNDGKITQQSVTLGARQGDLWEIVEGLKGGEVLAANNLNQLATGVNVRKAEAGGADKTSGQPETGGGSRGQGRGRGQGQPGVARGGNPR
jgi:RND family efflux transporter MFP subunit